jgi:hypothetical protein
MMSSFNAVISKPESARLRAEYNDLLTAGNAALSTFRRMHDRMESGASVKDVLEDDTYWPLEQLRRANG